MIETKTSHMKEFYLTIMLPLLLIKKNCYLYRDVIIIKKNCYRYRDIIIVMSILLLFYPFANSNFMVPMGPFDIISHILVT